jgi:drug/metabolite transporter (DMT)-like permease
MLSCFYAPEVFEIVVAPPSSGALLACAYLGVVASGLGYWLWYRVLAGEASHRVGITLMIQPAVGIPLAALIFGDELTPFFLAGTALIMAGVYLALSGSMDDSVSLLRASE